MVKPRGLLVTAQYARKKSDEYEIHDNVLKEIKLKLKEKINKQVSCNTKRYHGNIECVSLFVFDITMEILKEYGYDIISTKNMNIVFSWGNTKQVDRLRGVMK